MIVLTGQRRNAQAYDTVGAVSAYAFPVMLIIHNLKQVYCSITAFLCQLAICTNPTIDRR